MSDIKFKFSTDKQREINVGKEIVPEIQNQRKVGRHIRSLKVHLNNLEIRPILQRKPEGIIINIFPVKDARNEVINPTEPEWWTTRPLALLLTCSEYAPLPWAQFDEYDLDEIVTELFGKYIIEENLSVKEYPEIDTKLFTHIGILENNTVMGQDTRNKFSFNVEAKEIRESDIDYINDKYKIYGYNLKKSDALRTNQDTKTINNERKFTFEIGEF